MSMVEVLFTGVDERQQEQHDSYDLGISGRRRVRLHVAGSFTLAFGAKWLFQLLVLSLILIHEAGHACSLTPSIIQVISVARW
ncbi:hypothetical protein DF146_19300 [Burkholderia cenocepacia]|uniref:hypothetical protein n=1 Tax=Burkholderia cenocepacia TaxID=95486 RepID=UPI000F5A7E55|nr:hypothetical protein [Burkholderia cenocepacia]RQT95205.1 hypothetical protein DF165_14070 [Burkholderia cenocepacia]RQU51360.1 hypothetical protein DF146_19300 [Burkholderia cenocepacia]